MSVLVVVLVGDENRGDVDREAAAGARDVLRGLPGESEGDTGDEGVLRLRAVDGPASLLGPAEEVFGWCGEDVVTVEKDSYAGPPAFAGPLDESFRMLMVCLGTPDRASKIVV
ncbi:hypothetical protein [Streptomyces uncialis]|uniref:hypothetical protein n=1 Tax=Streptomyces uncialis TaxID=1048205 RepID=UPI0015B8FF13|nr:hypothetical protein [Streptomyces uncialis]